MSLYHGSNLISNVNVGSGGGGGSTYTLTVTNASSYINNVYYTGRGWTSGVQGVGIPSTVTDDQSTVYIGNAGSTGSYSRTFNNVSTVVLDGRGSYIKLYINNVYGEFSYFGICKLKGDTTIQLSGYASCFVEGTLITLADGSKKPIEKLTYEDELLVWDFDEGRQSTAKIVQLQRNQRTRHYNKLVLEDGMELYTVYNHSWFNITKNKFIRTMEATDIGDEIMTAFGPKKLVSKEELVDENHVWYYNLITEKVNCYANDILTSNHFSNLYPISNMKYVKEERELNKYEDFALYCSEETFNTLRVAEYDYSNYDQEAMGAEYRWLSLWQFHVIPKDADVYKYHNDYRKSRDLPEKNFNE